MNRPILVCALILLAAASLGAQESTQSNPYEGVSAPPPDDTIVTTSTPQAKPPAGQPAVAPQRLFSSSRRSLGRFKLKTRPPIRLLTTLNQEAMPIRTATLLRSSKALPRPGSRH
jgi:hypothetical protein